MSSQHCEFTTALAARLRPLYDVNAAHGHSDIHCEGMVRLFPQIAEHIPCDRWEFETSVWLHNLDRFLPKGGMAIAKTCTAYLSDSPFDDTARSRIIEAIANHTRLYQDDSAPLQRALQIADMTENLAGAVTIVRAITFSGPNFPICNPKNPFEYGDTDSPERNVLANFFRHLEWFRFIPPWARQIVTRERRQLMLQFLRQLGQEVAGYYGVQNQIEDCLKKALGHAYDEFVA